MPNYPILYEYGSREYNDCLKRTHLAVRALNQRNRYTSAMKRGEPNPFAFVPPKPDKKQGLVLKEYLAWKNELKDRPDSWWFKRIDAAIEESFYNAKVHALIWWDLCEKQTLDNEAWHARMSEYDFDRDLECDWDLVECALHCVGYHPVKAHRMSFEASDRKKWKEHRAFIYKCFECDAERTNLNYPPQRCTGCGLYGTMEQL